MKKLILTLLVPLFALNMSAQDYTQVYLIGGAAPNGWSNDKAISMTLIESNEESALFAWTGALKVGDFKFINLLNTWDPCFNATIEDEGIVIDQTHDLAYNEGGANDFKFFIAEAGFYDVTVDLKKLTLVISKAELSTPDYSQVYLIGDAAPNGWANDKAETMELISDAEDAIFSWSGPLKAGELKFINYLNSYNPSFTATTPDEDVVFNQALDIVYNTDGNDDFKFVIPNAGLYTVTVDLKNLTMVITENEFQLPEELWVIGSAIPNGIDKLSNAYGLSNFLYIGELLVGDFKIITSPTVDEFTYFIVPLEEDVDVTGETQLVITQDAQAEGWNVLVSDPVYKMKVDVVREQVSAEIFKSRDGLYMVGGAVETGWDVGNAVPFVRDANNPDLFVFDGVLKIRSENDEPDLFKIVGQQDWGPYSLHPYSANESILESSDVRIGGDDTKWKIESDKQGRYVIRVNTLYETIEAEYYDIGTRIEKTTSGDLYNIINTSNGLRIEANGNNTINALQIYNIGGQLVYSVRNAGTTAVIDGQVNAGIYLLKVDSGDKSFVQRVVVK